MAQDPESFHEHVPALRTARDNDTAILATRRSELMQLRAVLGGTAGTAGPLHEREIYLVASIKRLEEQLSAVKRAIARAEDATA